jgi:hypothetical protein
LELERDGRPATGAQDMDGQRLKLGRDGRLARGEREREREREREGGCRCFMFGAVDSRKINK